MDDKINKMNFKNNEQIDSGFDILNDFNSFYYVYQKLKEVTELPMFNNNVDLYKQEIVNYEERNIGIPNIIIPQVVNGAFAIELALKYLCYTDNKKYKRTHNLLILYNCLSEKTKSKIFNDYCKKVNSSQEVFERNLEIISNLFIDGRYYYEHDSLGSFVFLDDVLCTLRNFIYLN